MSRYIAIMSDSAANYAENLPENIEVHLLAPDSTIDVPVSSHPDMILCCLENRIFVPDTYYKEHHEQIDTISRRTGCVVVPSGVDRGRKYPRDIAFNVLASSRHIFSLTEYTAPEILSAAGELGYSSVRVRQGYSACSSIAVGSCIISADPSILKAAAEKGYDTLEISEGNISLDGYGCGFIGGATGVCGNTVYFLGNIMCHPDGERICGKLTELGFCAVSLTEAPLEDHGGIKFIRIPD